jgi:hypothetical protein
MVAKDWIEEGANSDFDQRRKITAKLLKIQVELKRPTLRQHFCGKRL